MSKDPFVGNSKANVTPGLTPGTPTGTRSEPDFSQFAYRIGFFQIGGEAGLADQAELESLLTRSLKNDGSVVIVDRKESISPATGVYTVVVTYMEKRINAQDSE